MEQLEELTGLLLDLVKFDSSKTKKLDNVKDKSFKYEVNGINKNIDIDKLHFFLNSEDAKNFMLNFKENLNSTDFNNFKENIVNIANWIKLTKRLYFDKDIYEMPFFNRNDIEMMLKPKFNNKVDSESFYIRNFLAKIHDDRTKLYLDNNGFGLFLYSENNRISIENFNHDFFLENVDKIVSKMEENESMYHLNDNFIKILTEYNNHYFKDKMTPSNVLFYGIQKNPLHMFSMFARDKNELTKFMNIFKDKIDLNTEYNEKFINYLMDNKNLSLNDKFDVLYNLGNLGFPNTYYNDNNILHLLYDKDFYKNFNKAHGIFKGYGYSYDERTVTKENSDLPEYFAMLKIDKCFSNIDKVFLNCVELKKFKLLESIYNLNKLIDYEDMCIDSSVLKMESHIFKDLNYIKYIIDDFYNSERFNFKKLITNFINANENTEIIDGNAIDYMFSKVKYDVNNFNDDKKTLIFKFFSEKTIENNNGFSLKFTLTPEIEKDVISLDSNDGIIDLLKTMEVLDIDFSKVSDVFINKYKDNKDTIEELMNKFIEENNHSGIELLGKLNHCIAQDVPVISKKMKRKF